VCSAADGELQILLPGETNRGDDVSGVRATHDDCWSPIDGTVPNDACLVVASVARTEYLARDLRPQRLDLRTRDRHVNLLLHPNPRSNYRPLQGLDSTAWQARQ
jgi:hypothetical protein